MVKVKKANFKIREVTLNKSNIQDYELLGPNVARKKRLPKIKALVKLYKSGKNTDAPIAITKNGKKLVVEGQHRITAIQNCIEDDENFEIEQTFFEYPSMTNKQVGKLFKMWNSGTPQSTDDYLQMFSLDIPIYNKMRQKHFYSNIVPVSIYPADGELHFRKWLGSYTASLKNSPGGNTETNENFVNTLSTLDQDDYNKFFDMAKSIHANIKLIFNRGYRQATTTGIAAIVYVYYHLVTLGNLDEKSFWKSFNKYAAVDEMYWDCLKFSGVTATKHATKQLLYLINKGQSNKDKLKIRGL